MTKDQLALARYGVRYDSVSAWGQAEIDADLELEFQRKEAEARRASREQLPEDGPPTDLPFTLDALGARMASLEQDNVELWQENGDLRAQIVELQDQLQNLKSSS